MKKEFVFRGKTLEELTKLSIKEFIPLLNSRKRRSLSRGLKDQQKILLEKVRKKDNNIRTHCRNMIILPEMINSQIKVHNGKEFVMLRIMPEMIGHFLGEFVLTRKKVGASRSRNRRYKVKREPVGEIKMLYSTKTDEKDAKVQGVSLPISLKQSAVQRYAGPYETKNTTRLYALFKTSLR